MTVPSPKSYETPSITTCFPAALSRKTVRLHVTTRGFRGVTALGDYLTFSFFHGAASFGKCSILLARDAAAPGLADTTPLSPTSTAALMGFARLLAPGQSVQFCFNHFVNQTCLPAISARIWRQLEGSGGPGWMQVFT